MKKQDIQDNQRAFCQLEGLTGIKKRKVDALFIKSTSDIKPTLEHGYACTSASDNGAFNVWKTDAGVIRGELMRYCTSIDSRIFLNYAEAEETVNGWLEWIK